MSDPNVEFAEPNYIVRADITTPNDQYIRQQWSLNNNGTLAGSTPDADIDAFEAWDILTTTPVVIAVIDSGIDPDHPDLVGRVTNTGWDFVNGDNDPRDDHGHGTHVAGTIGAFANNGVGIAGVLWNVQLMPLKILDATGSGTVANAIAAYQWAVANGARIMNGSFGGSSFSAAERAALQAAASAGVLLVAAAGNDSTNNDATPHYPSSYTGNVAIIAVAATDQMLPLVSIY
jgi:subtilisin family serine protease